jgi:hypothetical protein
VPRVFRENRHRGISVEGTGVKGARKEEQSQKNKTEEQKEKNKTQRNKREG